MAAIESIEDGFVIFDHNDRLLFCNEQYRAFYDVSKDLLVPGMTFENIIREGVRRGQYVDAVGREEEWIEARLALHRNPGHNTLQRVANDRWLKIAESKTQDGYTVGFRVDVTDLQRALLRAEASATAKKDFLNNISHEFRTPLALMLGYISFLKNVKILPQYKELETSIEDGALAKENLESFAQAIIEQANITHRSGKHMMDLINSVLDWSTLSTDHVELSLECFDVDIVIEEVRSQLHGIAAEKDISLTYQGQSCEIEADKLRITQILINLVTNAIKFTDHGFVHISLESREEEIAITVRDSGIGIANDQFDLIFERFAQVDTSTKRKYNGAGLGLAICKSLVELHNGSIRVESESGKGTAFTVQVPLRQSAP